jgi:hypothetical protein
MNAAIAKTLFQITQKQSIEDVSVAELSQLANHYPYFAPLQVLLAAKLKTENSYEASSQLQKAALFGNNPFWLEHGLFNGEAKDINIIPADKTASATQTNNQYQPQPTVIETEPLIVQDEPALIQIEEIKTIISLPSPISIPTLENVREIMEGIDKKEESINNTTSQPIQPAFIPVTEQAVTEEEIYHNPNEITDNYNEKQAEKLSSILSSSVADFKKPVTEQAQLDYEKEPAYTVDYFASQGIKADLTKQPQDKLTIQLLKFTDWLKIIKKSNPNPTDLGTGSALENTIQHIAQTSNEAKEIVTETMADVFVKQGKVDKAVQLYIKLSFLEPDKSSYFAARIQELKGI